MAMRTMLRGGAVAVAIFLFCRLVCFLVQDKVEKWSGAGALHAPLAFLALMAAFSPDA